MVDLSESDCFDLQHFAADASSLDAAAFAAKHGAGFLVMSKASSGLQVPDGPRKTVALESRTDQESWKPVRFRVWAIKKSERSLIGRFVSVGRTMRNDVVVPDVSLSKFHAYFVEEDGRFEVQDARSRNGTFVDGRPVARQGEGGATAVRSGSKVRFGAVELTFLDAAGLARLARELLR